jgi:hypothetical protein
MILTGTVAMNVGLKRLQSPFAPRLILLDVSVNVNAEL